MAGQKQKQQQAEHPEQQRWVMPDGEVSTVGPGRQQ